MKKLLSVSAMALVLLAGCGSTGPVSYEGQSAETADGDHAGEYTTVSYDKDGDDISNVNFDVFLPESEGFSSTSKKAVSDAGEYGMKEATGKSWTEHVTELETYINDNDAFPETVEKGEGDEAELVAADGTTSATIGLDSFKEAFEAAKEV